MRDFYGAGGSFNTMGRIYSPKISIITPSFNQGKYLERTILSILEQNYDNLEYLIVDGESTDNSIAIIRKYEKHITYWVSEQIGRASCRERV